RPQGLLERDDFSSNRHPALSLCLSMISAQTLRVCREGKPVPTFPDHALNGLTAGCRRALELDCGSGAYQKGALRTCPLRAGLSINVIAGRHQVPEPALALVSDSKMSLRQRASSLL